MKMKRYANDTRRDMLSASLAFASKIISRPVQRSSARIGGRSKSPLLVSLLVGLTLILVRSTVWWLDEYFLWFQPSGEPVRMADAIDQDPFVIKWEWETPRQKGIVLPLFDGNAILGLSLLHEIRCLGSKLPIEIHYCEDLSSKWISRIKKEISFVDFVDTCSLAFSFQHHDQNVFCSSLRRCKKIFRSFLIKPLALLFSAFDEALIVDADAIIFMNPDTLFDVPGYQQTGTLFFHDRQGELDIYLNRGPMWSSTSLWKDWVLSFNPQPFQVIPNARPRSGRKEPEAIPHVPPSKYLLTGHAWNRRSGHHQESSIVLFKKSMQARALSILVHFLIKGGPLNAYGDKEHYWLACEFAGSDYYMSPWADGALGSKILQNGKVICGDHMHVFPVEANDSRHNEIFHMNDMSVFEAMKNGQTLYRTTAQSSASIHYDKAAPKYCLANQNVVSLTSKETEKLTRRRSLLQLVENGDQVLPHIHCSLDENASA